MVYFLWAALLGGGDVSVLGVNVLLERRTDRRNTERAELPHSCQRAGCLPQCQVFTLTHAHDRRAHAHTLVPAAHTHGK